MRAIAHLAFDLGGFGLVLRPGSSEVLLPLNLELVIPVLAIASTDERHGVAAPYGM